MLGLNGIDFIFFNMKFFSDFLNTKYSFSFKIEQQRKIFLDNKLVYSISIFNFYLSTPTPQTSEREKLLTRLLPCA